MKIGLDWTTPRRMKASVVLRPDAVTDGRSIRREIDTRSGIKQDLTSDIQLLDLYELALLRDGIVFSAGVRARVFEDFKAYQDVLEFSFEPRDSRKAFGLYLDLPSLTKSEHFGDLSLRVALIGASDDRRTDRDVSEGSGDEGAGGKSPYFGVAIMSDLVTDDKLKIGAGVNLVETRLTDRKETKSLYVFGMQRALDIGTLPLDLGMDLRQSKSTYKSENLSLASTSSTSATVTGGAEIVRGRVMLFGLKVGSMLRQAADDTNKTLASRGVQAETGLRAFLGDGLDASSLVTREWCRSEYSGEGQKGCFGTLGDRKIAISRFVFQINYRTGGSI